MSDFIDRAKLEALAEEHTRDLGIGRWEEPYDDFMAGAAAYAALLDAETTEEFGQKHETSKLVFTLGKSRAIAERVLWASPGAQLVSRRVIYGPWLPSEGGEKRG